MLVYIGFQQQILQETQGLSKRKRDLCQNVIKQSNMRHLNTCRVDIRKVIPIVNEMKEWRQQCKPSQCTASLFQIHI